MQYNANNSSKLTQHCITNDFANKTKHRYGNGITRNRTSNAY